METNKVPDLFQDLSPAERIKALEGMCHSKGTEPIRHYYKEDEKQQMKDFVVQEGINLKNKKAEFAEIKKDFNEGIKQYETGIGDALCNLERGYSENVENVFFVDDQDAGLMHTYKANGEFHSSRKLHPEERQRTILSKVG